MTTTQTTAARAAAPALWGALGAARGSDSPATPTLDRATAKRHHETTPDGVISG